MAESENIIPAVQKSIRLIPFLLAAMWALGSTPAFAALELVGAFDPDTPSMNASVVALDGTAYLGSWGSEAHCDAPGVRVIDLRREAGYPLSGPLLKELGKIEEQGGKAILLLNRRGIAPALHCRESS